MQLPVCGPVPMRDLPAPHRLRHELIGIIPIMGDTFAYFIGAVTNKTGELLACAQTATQQTCAARAAHVSSAVIAKLHVLRS